MIYFLLLVIWVLLGFLGMFISAAGSIMGQRRTDNVLFKKVLFFPANCLIYIFKKVF